MRIFLKKSYWILFGQLTGRFTLLFLLFSYPGITSASDLPKGDSHTMGEITKEGRLLENRISIALENAEVHEFVAALRSQHHFPISFIQADTSLGKGTTLTLGFQNARLKDILGEVVSQNPAYQFLEYNKRLVVYPRLPEYHYLVRNINIVQSQRIQAAYTYIAELQSLFPEFVDLIAPPILGNINHFLFSDPVSLKQDARVIEHLIQLLGERSCLAFSIEKIRIGVRMLNQECISDSNS